MINTTKDLAALDRVLKHSLILPNKKKNISIIHYSLYQAFIICTSKDPPPPPTTKLLFPNKLG
jgi:hypothetical protein